MKMKFPLKPVLFSLYKVNHHTASFIKKVSFWRNIKRLSSIFSDLVNNVSQGPYLTVDW